MRGMGGYLFASLPEEMGADGFACDRSASPHAGVPGGEVLGGVRVLGNPGGTPNPPRSAWDLYNPRFVKGKGVDKMGLCPICVESPERGGEGRRVWCGMKVSAFKW